MREDVLIGSCPITLADLDHLREATRASALLSVQTDECRARFDIAHDEHRRHGERCGLVKAFRCARITLAGIELMHMIKKGQLRSSFPCQTAAEQFYSLAA